MRGEHCVEPDVELLAGSRDDRAGLPADRRDDLVPPGNRIFAFGSVAGVAGIYVLLLPADDLGEVGLGEEAKGDARSIVEKG